jgi:hypothetical protein
MENTPGNRILPEVRKLIGDDLVGGMSRKAAAEKWNISQSTASKIARERGLDGAQPPALVAASKAFMADVKERRARLKDELLQDVERLRHRAWSEYRRTVAGKDGPYEITEELPPLGEVRNAYAAIGVAITSYTKLEALDANTDDDENSKSLLGDILSGLTVVSQELEAREANGQHGNDVPADEVATINVVRGEVVSGD